MVSVTHPVLLYDGVCALCNWWVGFLLKHDRHDVFRFASLQSPLAAQVLWRHGASAQTLDTVYVVLDFEQPSEVLLAHSQAAIEVLRQLGPMGRCTATALSFLPSSIRDALYNFVARNRYRSFGRYDSCPLPDPKFRSKFLDL
jgi:predicted DCC family thiol-disulfide oxidoreductase YuxK